jgi:hypothetical protein
MKVHLNLETRSARMTEIAQLWDGWVAFSVVATLLSMMPQYGYQSWANVSVRYSIQEKTKQIPTGRPR